MTDVYSLVNARIIAELEQGVIPWHKPWASSTEAAHNRVTGRKYSLVNQLMLKHGGEYASYSQWLTLGGQVRKGEKAEIVIFWKLPEKDVDADADIGADTEQERPSHDRPVLKYYNVFHVSQVDGIDPIAGTSHEIDFAPCTAADNIIADYVCREQIGFEVGNYEDAYYLPAQDLIRIPSRDLFYNVEGFYATAFHELSHSTGAADRLNRAGVNHPSFGTEIYSKEKLIAEISAAYLMHTCNIDTASAIRNSAAYIQAWLEVLKNDRHMLVSAAGYAEKAAAFILNSAGGITAPVAT